MLFTGRPLLFANLKMHAADQPDSSTGRSRPRSSIRKVSPGSEAKLPEKTLVSTLEIVQSESP